MADLGCAKATCVKIMKELDTENGIGLIEKKRRGLGKPGKQMDKGKEVTI